MRVLFSEEQNRKDEEIIQFGTALLDVLLFILFLAVVLMWVPQVESEFAIKVVRITDGISRFYNVGRLSIQRTAAFVLKMYYKDFAEYNPHFIRVHDTSVMKHLSQSFTRLMGTL